MTTGHSKPLAAWHVEIVTFCRWIRHQTCLKSDYYYLPLCCLPHFDYHLQMKASRLEGIAEAGCPCQWFSHQCLCMYIGRNVLVRICTRVPIPTLVFDPRNVSVALASEGDEFLHIFPSTFPVGLRVSQVGFKVQEIQQPTKQVGRWRSLPFNLSNVGDIIIHSIPD